MKIVDVITQRFTYKTRRASDSEGHSHPGPERDATHCVLRILTDEGVEGCCFGANPAVIQNVVRPALIGEDPLYREKIWQRLAGWQRIHRALDDRVLATVDLALWDLAGHYLGQPVYKLLGASRDKVKAYASTMCGDEIAGGLGSPEDYANFAARCQDRGYQALKLHTWMPPIPWAPDPKKDVACCRAIRERVGPDMVLMLDCYHRYSREAARFLGKELEKLDFYWIEEPMDEHSTSSYAWLARELDIALVGPETAEGKMQTRAEWIVRGASDISRGGVNDVGGITPLMKTAHLCEAFGVQMEVHGGGAGNLHALCAMGVPGEYYERGLLHPFLDYEQPDPWLNEIVDPLDQEGYVHVSSRPGLGLNVNWDFIREHAIS